MWICPTIGQNDFGDDDMGDLQSKTKRREAGEDLLTVEERTNALKKLQKQYIFEYDMLRDVFFFSKNSSFAPELHGLTFSDCIEKIRRTERIYEQDVENFIEFLRNEDKEKCEFRYIKEDGTSVWCLAKGTVITDEKGTKKVLVGTISDIDKEKQMHEMLVEQALMDPLTKLYTRTKAQSIIEEYLRKEGSFGKHALMIINIKDFHKINKQYGSAYGDKILMCFAEKLTETFRQKDIIARIGGDDFLVLLKDISDMENVERKMHAVVNLMSEITMGNGNRIFCNVGVSCFPKHGRNFSMLFRNADCALYKAKETGAQGCEIYDTSCRIDEYNKRGEFYHEYVIRNRKKDFGGDFDRQITDYAVDTMVHTKDVATAVKELLEKIGKFYSCDDVYVLEVDDNEILHTTYCWNGTEGINHYNAMQFADLRELPPMDTYFDERGIRMYTNTSIMRNQSVYAKFIGIMNAKSLLQCAIFQENVFCGCVCVGHQSKTHEWTKEEVNTLLTVTKLLSVYLLRFKETEKIQARIERLANFDTLTGLSTQYKFRKDANKLLNKNPRATYAVIYMDINKFKYINDTLGYEAGDNLLREISKTASAETYDIVLMGRVLADNFLLMMNYVNEQQIIDNLTRLNTNFLSKVRGYTVGESTFLVSGISLVKSGMDVTAAIDNANLARKSIKKTANAAWCFYDKKLAEQIETELDICNSMQKALERKEFKMFLQPKVDLQSNKVVGGEALTRWKRIDGKMMYPDEFVPLFEKNGFIIQLDFYIYECACKAIRKWIDRKIKPVTISVNVSRVHLNTENFVERINDLVRKYKVPRKYLEFELTESVFLDTTDAAITTMKKLRDEGYHVSIDDFGAGYSSLNLLKDMASDVLKLDKEFFGKGEMTEEEKIIVSSITNMAKQLKMKVLSEGVETQAQSEFLKQISCDMAQGYLYAKPMQLREFTELLMGKANL